MSIQQNYGNIKPSLNLDFANTKQLDPRITYSRASTGTYYDGKTVAKAEENLLLWSQEFQNTGWLRSGAAIAADTSIAPDGTTTADTLTASAGSNSHLTQRLASVVANQNYTYTVYAKYATAQYIAFGFASGALGSAWAFVTVDIQNGTITQTTNGSNLSSTALGAVTSVGNGWYRITVTGSHSQTDTYPTIHIVNTSTPSFGNFGAFTWTAAGTETVLLWGAQLEQRSTATAYTPTTTAPITKYIPVLQTASAGTPRFDHNPITGESLGLLIEEQRTNLMTYSEQFDNAAWFKVNSTATANQTTAPNGTTTADTLTDNATNGSHAFQAPPVTTTVQTYTLSVFAKANSLSRIMLYSLNADNKGSGFDLSNGTTFTVTGIPLPASSSISDAGNGWYRCSITFTGAAFTGVVGALYAVTGTAFSYAGTGQSLFLWGAQLEAGAFATSYIPTVASQVTRAADSASMTGTNFSSWYNPSEGSVLADYAIGYLPSGSMLPRIASINDGSTANCVDLFINAFWPRTAGLVRTNSTSVVDTTIGSNLTATTSEKSIIGYKINDFALTKNGLAAVNDTDGVVPQVVNRLQIGANSESRSVNGTIKKLAYYPRRLTNTQIQSLTS